VAGRCRLQTGGTGRFCRKCGAALSERSKFCPKCGAPVPAASPATAAAVTPTPPQPQPAQSARTALNLTEANNFARDKLKRGDTPANVGNQLLLSGFSQDHAMTIINGAQVELRKARKKAWRRRGGQLLGGGIALIILIVIPIYAYQSIGGGGTIPSAILTWFGVGELAGIALLIGGIAAIVYSFT
jgi:hypothetical protein